MPETRYVNVDLVRVFRTAVRQDGEQTMTTLAWGDPVTYMDRVENALQVGLTDFELQPDGSYLPVSRQGFIRLPKKSTTPESILAPEPRVLKVDFVDVQQGDGTVIETPKGQVVLVDGGDNQLFARYLAGRFRGTSNGQRKEIACIVVSHGDADHFSGLTEIHKSETHKGKPYKRLFIRPRRVYHNGLVKRPTKVPEAGRLGATTVSEGVRYVVGLEEDLLAVDRGEMNKDFAAWRDALEAWRRHGEITFRRIEQGNEKEFKFLAEEGIKVDVLGPITSRVGGKKALRFLGEPPKGPRIGHESVSLEDTGFEGESASHTINGHSIILRLTYGGVRFLLSGDLNDQAGRDLVKQQKKRLRAEVFKVPHHGSADFSGAFVKAVAPVISVVSSGDESARKEYIHPRATLMGALGKYSRVDEPLIFVTELVAFFDMVGYVDPESHRRGKDVPWLVENGQPVLDPKALARFFAFQRTAFGIVKVRTDGKRLLVYTNSGQRDMKEAYAYEMKRGTAEPSAVVRV